MIIPCKSKYNLRVSIEVCIGITCKIFFLMQEPGFKSNLVTYMA